MRSKLLKGTMVVCGLLVAAATLTGCQRNLKEQNAHLMEENRGLRDQLADRNYALETSRSELLDRDQRLADTQRQLDDANASLVSAQYTADPYDSTQYAADPNASGQSQGAVGQYTAPIANPFGGIEGVAGSFGAGEITATLQADLLFDPGKTALKESAKRSLNSIVQVINGTYAGQPIRVSGHTDPDPIRKSGFKSNYHLGFERAYAVREYLVQRGIAPQRLYVASHGPDQAKATKKECRRVEIAVVLNDS